MFDILYEMFWSIVLFKMGVAASVIFCLCLSYSTAQHTSFHFDTMSIGDRKKLQVLSLEFIYQMQLMQRQLLPIKLAHVTKISYQVGLFIGIMREKYKRMMDVYMELMRKDNKRQTIMPPGVWTTQPLHHLIAMETIRQLEIEIDKYVDVLNNIPEEEFTKDEDDLNKMLKPPVMDSAAVLRNGTRVEKPAAPAASSTAPQQYTRSTITLKADKRTVLSEEDVKRQYRQNFMKQNGISENDWSLDRHYGFV